MEVVAINTALAAANVEEPLSSLFTLVDVAATGGDFMFLMTVAVAIKRLVQRVGSTTHNPSNETAGEQAAKSLNDEDVTFLLVDARPKDNAVFIMVERDVLMMKKESKEKVCVEADPLDAMTRSDADGFARSKS